MFLWFNIDRILFSMETILGEKPAGSLFCGFAFAFDQHAKSLHSVIKHILRFFFALITILFGS